MFHIECFVDDKNLAKVKWALFELGAYNVTDKPVKSNSKTNGVHRTPLNEMPAAFLVWAKKQKHKQFTKADLVPFVQEHGFSAGSCQHVREELMRTKVLTKVPGTNMSRARYQLGKTRVAS